MIRFMIKLEVKPYYADIWFTNSKALYLRKRAEIGVTPEPWLDGAGGMTTYYENGWQQVSLLEKLARF